MPQRHRVYARGRAGQAPPGTMNKMESRYAARLKLRQMAGEIVSFGFERITLVLAHGHKGVKGLRYNPDFDVLLPDGTFEFHECKGFRDEKNMAKLKMAAELFPFRFFLVTESRRKGESVWTIQEY